MQLVAINWHVYVLTKSALALGLVGLFRGLPVIVCSLAGGVVADAVNRKRLMIVTQTVMLVSAGLLTATTFAGIQSVWPIYVLSALASAATAFDIPARQSLMPTLVPLEVFPNAVSLSMIVFNVATIGGPAIAGVLLAETGPATIYAINALSFVAVIIALVAMRASGSPELQTARKDALSFAAMKEGLK
jgi:MFS family permease